MSTIEEGRTRPKTVVLSAVLGVTLVGGAWMLQRGAKTGAPQDLNGIELFREVSAHVRDDFVDSVGAARMYRLAIDGMLSELNDPYDAYLTPERTASLAERTRGDYAGIGLQVDVRDGYVVVVNPVPGSPGERAGILTGDRIVQVDGHAVTGFTPDEVQRLLRGSSGSLVALTLEHPGSVKPYTVTLERRLIHTSAVKRVALLPSRAGYVQVSVFSDSTARELTRATDSLVRAGAKSLVLDLRSNPGGLLDQGVSVAGVFLDKGVRIASTRGRTRAEDAVFSDSAEQRWPSLPVAVLVDDKTASAAEVVAGALQDHDRAVIVGLPTYGKGSVQHVVPLSVGAVRLTTARWYTPLGRQISRPRVNDDAAADSDSVPPSFKTAGGRKVVGGGGITPDVAAGDTVPAPESYAFMRALGTGVATFHDVITSYALELKAKRAVSSPDFAVTPAMRDEIYKRMVARKLDVPRFTYDAAAPLVSRLFGYEVARYVFGADAEFRRKAADDRMLLTAERLLANAKSQSDVLARAAAMAKPHTGE